MSRGLLGGGALVVALAGVGLHLCQRAGLSALGGGTPELPPPAAYALPPGSPPELPHAHVEMPPAVPTGNVRVLHPGEDLQAAVDAAQPGDVIALDPGAGFGALRLPKKPGNDWITIRTSVPDGTFPPPGTRVDPSQAALMPKMEAASGSAITAAPGAHHYRFIGVEVRPHVGAFLYNLVELGASETSLDAVPHHIVFERCYVHGDPQVGGRRGIALNAQQAAVVDSYLADFKEQGADSQAICGWNGLGPFAILNNYLEAAGENVMFGGVDPSITNLVPSDIEIRRNRLTKPLAWKQGEPGYQGTGWTVKNLFELKNARRVLVDGNVFENNWVQSQAGFAVLFTVRNQDGGAPWSVVEDVTFSNNAVRHSASGVQILGRDDNHPSQQAQRLLMRNNLFADIGGPRWGGGGRLFQIVAQAADVVIAHTTALHAGNIITTEQGPFPGFVFRDNIAPHNEYGIIGTGTAPGKPTLVAYFPDVVVRRNVIVGGPGDSYPADNFFPATLAEVGFVDVDRDDYRLRPTSPYRRAATDGKDIGVDLDELLAAASAPGRPVPAP